LDDRSLVGSRPDFHHAYTGYHVAIKNLIVPLTALGLHKRCTGTCC
jgi:hypothetical protein